LYRYTVGQAAAHFCPPLRNPDRNRRLQKCIERLWKGNECVILRCDECGFGFGHPFVAGDEEFYGILHEQKGYPSWRWDYDVAVSEAIEKYQGGKVLDIGAGVGMFLRGLNDNWDLYAVEGSELTRRQLEAANIKVFRNLEEAAQQQAGTFQVITLFQVLEHIAEFEFVLKQCQELLAPGGQVVVTVPDGDAMIRQERVTGCADMPPNHVGKWTPQSLTLALGKAGFKASAAIPEPASLKNVKANLHMRMVADAAKENSISAFAYKIKVRQARIAALSILAVPALLRMLPHAWRLRAGGAFAIIGSKR
jgi:2-polyprenyl-3-methyl-5-hydroxy-6-metoxy-1,4-benzoquinol methylase